MSEQGILAINDKVRAESAKTRALIQEISKVLIGQEAMVHRLLVGLFSGGHVLLEGVPGLAKTLAVKAIASALDASFQRIQFTPDLLPADLVGTLVYNPQSGEFTTRKGPVFASVVLADEINRAPAKVQSALLEAMQEGQVTIGKETFPLPHPFWVLATENPVEQEGTYPLPEAQVDRFMLKVLIGYPSRDEEKRILDAHARTGEAPKVSAVMKTSDVLAARKLVDEIYLDDKIKDYILSLVFATRDPAAAGLAKYAALIRYGASPRATLALTLAGKACAFLAGRGYVTPDDIKTIAPEVLRHRVIPSFEAEADEITSETIVRAVLDAMPVP
jgi:MoxR-like ATPase